MARKKKRFVALVGLYLDNPKNDEYDTKVLVVGVFNTEKKAHAEIQDIFKAYKKHGYITWGDIAPRWEPLHGSVVEVEEGEPYADAIRTMLIGE